MSSHTPRTSASPSPWARPAFLAPALGVGLRAGGHSAGYAALLVTLFGMGHAAVIALAGTFGEAVQRYLRWSAGSKGPVLVRSAAGVLVVLGGLYFLYTAVQREKGLDAVRDVVGKVWPWVLAGIAVGAAVHGYVPAGLLAGLMGKSAWWSVPAAVAVGVPMYSNAAGTVLAFMMAVIALSLPEIIIVRKVLRPPLIAAFVGVVASGILLVGWLFNAIL